MFCLSARSHFSIGRSILSPARIVGLAAEYGYDSVILTDDATISGMTKLFDQVRQHETPVKAVIGVSIKIYDDPSYRPPSKKSGEKAKPNEFWEAKLLVKNEDGLKALYRLLSAANSEEYFYYTPRVGLKELIVAMMSHGLILLTGDFHSLFRHSNYYKIAELLGKHIRATERVIELVPVKNAYFDRINTIAAKYSLTRDWRCVYNRPSLYEQGGDDARDVMSYIINHSSVTNRLRNIPFNRDLHLMKPDELATHHEALAALVKARTDASVTDDYAWLVRQCEFEWQKSEMCLPKMAEQEFAELVALCKAGWKDRFEREVFGYKPPAEKMAEYKARLQYELKVLKDMGFDRYFLLVRDVIMWCKDNKLRVGPARGSSAGSLVAYLIGITDVDPLRFGLIFERFLNPDRLDYPDVDTDFMSSRRQEVIDYMVSRYGREYVAGISNYSMLGTPSAIRDVGRMYGASQEELRCTRVLEDGMTVETAKELPEISKYADKYPEAFAIAGQLSGAMRALGQHAAGVVVAGEPLIERAVVENRKGGQTVGWDKRNVEDFGLIKLDILGLSTLDILQIAVDKIAERHHKTIDLNAIPLSDDKVLQAFAAGKTVGVFQFTSGGMRHLLKSLAEGGRKLTFEDVYAATALHRPGPLQSGMTEEYVRVKQGITKPHYEHHKMENALRETRGVITYQEQVMQIARDLCGYTMGESDKLRKIMGKKLPEEMEKQREKFVAGAVEHSEMEPEHASHLFDQIAEFAGYGFNKSHAVSYSLISYQCMWLKTYYPAEFYAATLSVVKEDDLTAIVKDAYEHGVHIVPPCINRSTGTFEIGYDDKREQHILYAPLNRVKQISERSTTMIMEARKAGPFTSKADFVSRIQARFCNKRAQDNLDKVGAFCAIDPDAIDARHPDRLKDQKELLPNLMLSNVKASRIIDIKTVKPQLQELVAAIEGEGEDEEGLSTGIKPVTPSFGARPKFMFLTDCAAYSEENAGKFADGKSFNYTLVALKAAGLKKSEGYYSALVKAKKKDKQLSNEEVKHWAHYLDTELELLKPNIIVAAGGAVIRHLCPDVKGGWEALSGQVVYDVRRDCSIYFAPNPQMTYVRPEVQDILTDIMSEVAEALS